MSFHVEVEGGKRVKLPTAGMYCDRDVVVTGSNNPADLQAKYDEGVTAGAALCAARHFDHSYAGDGSGSVSFYVPFEPDMVQIIGFDPTFNKKPYALASFSYDRRAFGLMGGSALYGQADGTVMNGYYTTVSALTRYSRAEDGTVTIGNFSSSVPVEFSLGYPYTAIAVRYTEQTDRERIAAFVEGLTGSGTVTLNKAKVEAAFTDDEWAGLVAARPDWTFTWI